MDCVRVQDHETKPYLQLQEQLQSRMPAYLMYETAISTRTLMYERHFQPRLSRFRVSC